MPSKIIGKSTLGELGFCQYVPTMGERYFTQWEKLLREIPKGYMPIITSMTNMNERKEANNFYIPQIRLYDKIIDAIFNPTEIYKHCLQGVDFLRPTVDFAIWKQEDMVVGLTFSKDAPIISFVSTNGGKAIGTILRPALMAHGMYLFDNIQNAMKSMGNGEITVTLETSTFSDYKEGCIPTVIERLAKEHGMNFKLGVDTREHSECYHSGEKGNHIVALW